MGLRTAALRRVLEVAAAHGWQPAGTWRLTNTVRLPDGSVEQRFSKGGGLVVDEDAGRQLGVSAYLLPRHRIDRMDAWALLVVLSPLVELGGELADDETARLLAATIRSAPGADLDALANVVPAGRE
ncbi:MAG: hypothetical protein KY450_08735, partial [Actinobacteria bacterium]|nr:hypothetical protein [Actinomycetota bacterium]